MQLYLYQVDSLHKCEMYWVCENMSKGLLGHAEIIRMQCEFSTDDFGKLWLCNLYDIWVRIENKVPLEPN